MRDQRQNAMRKAWTSPAEMRDIVFSDHAKSDREVFDSIGPRVENLPKWERVKVYNDVIAGVEAKHYDPKYQAAKIEILEHLKKRVDDIVDGRC